MDILKSLDINDNYFVFEIMNQIIASGGRFMPKFIENNKHIMNIDNNNILKKIKRYYAQNFSM